MRAVTGVGIVFGALAIGVAVGAAFRRRDGQAHCGKGFTAQRARCVAPSEICPPPLLQAAHGCDAPALRVAIPSSTLTLGPSDWEAEGRVEARTFHVAAFELDAFEVTRGRWATAQGVVAPDAARAASAITRDEAAAFCASAGGRLPTEEEWISAAASGLDPPRRYPWGDTGAVCRRAAWGLLDGPCACTADGPDTVGAHADGDTPLGLHDLAGNVAEWVAPSSEKPALGVAKGGSWQTSLAADLRIWARLELSPLARDARVGVRCAYDR